MARINKLKIVDNVHNIKIPDIKINREVLLKLKTSHLDDLYRWETVLCELIDFKNSIGLGPEFNGWQPEVTLKYVRYEIKRRKECNNGR